MINQNLELKPCGRNSYMTDRISLEAVKPSTHKSLDILVFFITKSGQYLLTSVKQNISLTLHIANIFYSLVLFFSSLI